MKVSVFIATSLDGFIARTNGSIDWLIAVDEQDSSEDYGYQEFYDSIDCLIMGRNSMEKIIDFPEWPYENKRVVVLSSTLVEVPAQHVDKFELYSGSLTELVKQLEIDGCESLYIDGGKTIQSFINNGLVTDITITTIPVLLGEGLPLFGKIRQDIKLTHIETKSYPNGFVTSTYEI
ncbi:MAG: dihydrofolate reductase family protein [gamma proteobacterium symbiont of Taylorina sp.]|nr:dihydrofolate reductase family protein [gamma proteobacterium symbiont of Taylorina sp.]